MRISDWSSDVCSSDLIAAAHCVAAHSPAITIANTTMIWPMSNLVGVIWGSAPKGGTAARVHARKDQLDRRSRKSRSRRATTRLEAPRAAKQWSALTFYGGITIAMVWMTNSDHWPGKI